MKILNACKSNNQTEENSSLVKRKSASNVFPRMNYRIVYKIWYLTGGKKVISPNELLNTIKPVLFDLFI